MWSDKILEQVGINHSGDFPNMVCYVQNVAEEIRRFKQLFIDTYD